MESGRALALFISCKLSWNFLSRSFGPLVLVDPRRGPGCFGAVLCLTRPLFDQTGRQPDRRGKNDRAARGPHVAVARAADRGSRRIDVARLGAMTFSIMAMEMPIALIG